MDADAKPVTQSVYAIDCEMVPAPDCVLGYRVLTKTNTVSVPHQGRQGADSSLRQARSYDQLVKPPSPITDYLSFSGITAQALEPMTTTLADVQAHLQALISPSTILLGHSLESDLRALQLSHPQCIDTAVIFHHPRGRPLKPGLAWLARKWLGRTIQDRGAGGHDPEEDAMACVDLLRAKIKNGTYPSHRTRELVDGSPFRTGLRRVQNRLRTDPWANRAFAIT